VTGRVEVRVRPGRRASLRGVHRGDGRAGVHGPHGTSARR
jgi:hypothetical protein